MKPISKSRAISLFILMAGLYSISFFQRIAVPGTVFNDIQRAFAISAGAVTALSSIYLFIYAGQQFFIGMLTDRFGGARVTMTGGLILCVGAVLFPLSDSLWLLYLSRGLVGLGAGAMYLSGIKEIDLLFDRKNFATLVGVFCVIGYGGGLLGTKPFRYLVDSMGWRHALLVVAILAVVILIATFFCTRGTPSGVQNNVDTSILKNIKQVLTNGLAYPLIIAGMINFSIYFSMQSTIGPKFIGDILKLPPKEATHYTFVMMLCTMITMLVAGPLSRICGNSRKPFLTFASVISFIAVTVLLGGTLFMFPPFCFMLAFIMLAISAGLIPVTISFIKELNHENTAGLSVGTQNTATYVAVAISTGLIGLVLDAFKGSATTTAAGVIVYPISAYITIFSIMLAFSTISLFAAFKSRETKGQNIYHSKFAVVAS